MISTSQQWPPPPHLSVSKPLCGDTAGGQPLGAQSAPALFGRQHRREGGSTEGGQEGGEVSRGYRGDRGVGSAESSRWQSFQGHRQVAVTNRAERCGCVFVASFLFSAFRRSGTALDIKISVLS